MSTGDQPLIHSRNIRYIFDTLKLCQILGWGGAEGQGRGARERGERQLINNVPSLKIGAEKIIKTCKCKSTGTNGPPEGSYPPEKERCGFSRGKEVTMRYAKRVVKTRSATSSGKEIMGA